MSSAALRQLARLATCALETSGLSRSTHTLQRLAVSTYPQDARCTRPSSAGGPAVASTSYLGCGSTHRQYGSPATSPDDSGAVEEQARPVGKGFGFKMRFKDMKDVYLRKLLDGETETEHKARVRLLPPPVPSQQGEHEHQYERTEQVITEKYEVQQRNLFAVVEAGHGQFKVALDDKIFVHRMHGVDVNDVVSLNRVLLAGSPSQTLIGRPYVPGVTVRAAVEEHIRDSTVYIYKRTRASGYRRFRGFRAELTGLRILSIEGTEAKGVESQEIAVAPYARNVRRKRNRKARLPAPVHDAGAYANPDRLGTVTSSQVVFSDAEGAPLRTGSDQ